MEREPMTAEQMDNAAWAAADELVEMDSQIAGRHKIQTLPELADWWRRWYLLAGHKRLGRIIMGVK